MIIELTNNKLTNNKINEEKVEKLKDFFQSNFDVWYKADQLECVIEAKRIRAYINELRNSGLPIISSRKGYKLTEDKEQIKKCYDELRLRALRMLTASKNMKMFL